LLCKRAIVFEVHGVNAKDEAVLRKTLRRDAVTQFFADLPPCIVGMEACSGSHYWAKVFADLGHEVRLISPQFVTPYVKSNKNDRNDAEAICEAIADRRCASCRSSLRNNLRSRPFIVSAKDWLRTEPGW
jgi:transposase